jgi:hypothetical protein
VVILAIGGCRSVVLSLKTKLERSKRGPRPGRRRLDGHPPRRPRPPPGPADRRRLPACAMWAGADLPSVLVLDDGSVRRHQRRARGSATAAIATPLLPARPDNALDVCHPYAHMQPPPSGKTWSQPWHQTPAQDTSPWSVLAAIVIVRQSKLGTLRRRSSATTAAGSEVCTTSSDTRRPGALRSASLTTELGSSKHKNFSRRLHRKKPYRWRPKLVPIKRNPHSRMSNAPCVAAAIAFSGTT